MEALHLRFAPLRETPQEVLDCELSVLGHAYGDTPELLEEAYGRYREDTAFVSLWWRDEAVGFVRFIRPGRHELKTLADIRKEPWGVDGAGIARGLGVDLDRTWDLATIGVRRHDREVPARATPALVRGFAEVLRANDVEWLIAIVDETARRLMSMYGIRSLPLPGTRAEEYMGSPACQPAFGRVDESAEGLCAQPLPSLHLPAADELRWPETALAAPGRPAVARRRA